MEYLGIGILEIQSGIPYIPVSGASKGKIFALSVEILEVTRHLVGTMSPHPCNKP